MRHLLTLLIAMTSLPVGAETLTAECKEPTGRTFGWEGEFGKKAAVDEQDRMTGGDVTIIWPVGADEAQILTRASSTGPVLTEKAIRIFQSDEQVSFVVPYPPLSVYMYSFFPKPQKLLVSGHWKGRVIDSGGAIGKSYSASCTLTVR